MTPGMSLRRDAQTGEFGITGEAPEPLSFQNVPFGLVIEAVQNAYNVKITVTDPALLEKRINTRFSGETIDEVMDALAYMTSASVEKLSAGEYRLQPL